MPTLRKATEADHSRLYDIWFTAVRDTHHFLPSDYFDELCNLIKTEFLPNAEIGVLVDDEGESVGMIQMVDSEINALFIHSDHFRKGHGEFLINWAKGRFDTLTLDVNEQNPQAIKFYKAQGFKQTGRQDVDHQGRPYPILRMEYVKGA